MIVPELKHLLLILVLEQADDAVFSRLLEGKIGGQDAAVVFQGAFLLRLVRGDHFYLAHGIFDRRAAVGLLEVDHDVMGLALVRSHVHAGQAHHLEFCIDAPLHGRVLEGAAHARVVHLFVGLHVVSAVIHLVVGFHVVPLHGHGWNADQGEDNCCNEKCVRFHDNSSKIVNDTVFNRLIAAGSRSYMP